MSWVRGQGVGSPDHWRWLAGPIYLEVRSKAPKEKILKFSCPFSRRLVLPPVLTLLSMLSGVELMGQRAHLVRLPHQELRLMDVIALDDEGRPVLDLTAEDLQVSERGKLQEVVFFEYFDHLQTGLSGDGLRPGSGKNQDLPIIALRQVPTVFAIDLNSLESTNLEAAKQTISEVVASLEGKGNSFMLVCLYNGLKIRCPLTRNSQQFTAALESISASTTPLRYLSLLERIASRFRGAMPAQAMEGALQEGKLFLIEMKDRIRSTCQSLEELANHLSTLPGRKNLILFSEGYPLNAGPVVFDILTEFNESRPGQGVLSPQLLSAKLGSAFSDDASLPITESVHQLNRGLVSVYGVDPRGPVSADLMSMRDRDLVPQKLLTRRNAEDIVAPRRYLVKISGDTGGRTFADLNEIAPTIESTLDVSQSYYLVGYAVSEKEKGKAESFPGVKISCSRPNVELSFRQDPAVSTQMTSEEQDLKAAFQFPNLYNDFPIEPEIEPSPGQLTVRVRIPTDSLFFFREGDQFICQLSLYGVFLDASGQMVTDGKKFSFAKQFNLQLTQEKLDAFRRTATVTALANATVSSGNYGLVILVEQKPSRLLSAFQMEAKIP